MPRIALIGSHCVGKTTLVHPLAARLGLPVIEEQARVWCQERGIADINTVVDVEDMQWGILEHQIAAEQRAPSFLSDRSTIDNAAYYLSLPQIDYNPMAYVREAKANAATSYTHLFLIPVDDTIVGCQADGFRYVDPVFRLAVDGLVRRLVAKWGLAAKLHVVRGRSVEERLDEMVAVVNQALVVI